MNGNQKQLSEQVLGLQKELSCSEEATQELINKLKSAQTEKKEANQKLAEANTNSHCRTNDKRKWEIKLY